MNSIEGGCLCSNTRYRVTGEPLFSVICHCKTCRKASGAPSVGWLTFNRDSFEILSGQLRTFSSSQGVIRTFCAVCGTPLTYENEQAPGTLDVTTVSLDEPHIFAPDREVWLEHKLSWNIRNEALDAYLKDSSGEKV